MESVKIVGHRNLIRDVHSMAVLSVDSEAYAKHKKKTERDADFQKQIDSLKKTVDDLVRALNARDKNAD